MNPESVTSSAPNRLRPGIVSTRLSPSEMAAVDAAVGAAETSRSSWLREAALSHLGQPDPTPHLSLESTVLAEIMSLRLVLINLFAAATPGLALQTMHQIMNFAESTKHAEAAKVLRCSIENELPK